MGWVHILPFERDKLRRRDGEFVETLEMHESGDGKTIPEPVW